MNPESTDRPLNSLRQFVSGIQVSQRRDLLFLLVTLVVVVLRFRILRDTGAPATIDAGNWLAFGDTLLGRGVRSTSIVYPPLIPLATTGAVGLLGFVNGVAAMAALSSAAPALGVYWTLRRCRLGFGAVVPSLLVLGAAAVGEAAAWGGFPQLIGLGMLPVTLFWFDRMARTWSIRDAMWAGVWLTLVLATSHLIGSIAVLASLLIVLYSATGWRVDRPSAAKVASRVALTLIPTVWLAPLYLTLTRQVFRSGDSFRHLTQLTWGNLFGRVEFLFRDQAAVWWVIFVLVLLTPVLLVKRRDLALWRLSSALLATTAVVTLLTREGRYLYVFTVIAGLSVGLWMAVFAQRLRLNLADRLPADFGPRLALGLAAVSTFIAIQIAGGLDLFEHQRNFYGVLDSDLVAAIEHVGDTIGPGDTIGVTSLRDAPLGWWVEAITDGSVVYAAPLRWLVFEDELERAAAANRLFAPPFPNRSSFDKATDLNIDVIVVPTDWTFYDEAAIAQLESAFPDAVDRFNPGATLLYPAAALP